MDNKNGYAVNDDDDDSHAEFYNPATDEWTPFSDKPAESHAFGVVAAGGRVFAIGGDASGAPVLDSVWAYDPTGDYWTEMPEMRTEREHLGVTFIDDAIYVAGGEDEDGEPLNSVEIFRTGQFFIQTRE